MEDAVRQRIKYLVEHGELYPVEKHLERSLAVKLLGLLVALQIAQLLLLLMLCKG